MLDGSIYPSFFLSFFLVTGVRQRCGNNLMLLRGDRIFLRGRIGLVSGGLCGDALLAQGPSSGGLLAENLRAALVGWSR